MDVIRLGLMCDPRKICQDFSRAMPRSTSARARASAWLTVRWVGAVRARAAFETGGHPGAGALIGALGQNGDTLSFADPDDAVRGPRSGRWPSTGERVRSTAGVRPG